MSAQTAGPDFEGVWAARPLFALDADVTIYWPDVRPCYDAPALAALAECVGVDEVGA